MPASSLIDLLEQALGHRAGLLDSAHEGAFRLFNGFSEGMPELVIDVYGRTVVFNNYALRLEEGRAAVDQAQAFVQKRLPWVQAGVLKTRTALSPDEKRGQLLFGAKADTQIREHGTWYAIDLTLNRDASFYLDTRNLRAWILAQLGGKTVLNTFAYTGSLGVAARAAGAGRVVQLDRNERFLLLAKKSCELNGFAIDVADFVHADFFRKAASFRRAQQVFDCVILDPPYFASFTTGTIDQIHESARLINKVRPLVAQGGFLVAINNSLHVSGAAYRQILESLCADGYLRVAQLIPVPEDVLGFAAPSAVTSLPDPAPFNHATKIAVLEVRRKGS
jgi:23S rRNA (cytosine1962-C5)-methyltransferase